MDEKYEKHGSFSWNELMTTDVDAARRFYGELFGWTFKDMPMEDMTYTVISVDGAENAGMMPMPPQAGPIPPNWGAYVTVKDVDATAKQATALGGAVIVPPMDIPGVGRFAVLRDPQGAVISAITYGFRDMPK